MPFTNTLPAPFVVTPVQTSIAIAYKNEEYIADAVLPRVPVDTPAFNYMVHNKADMFTVPDTKVGRKSYVPEVDWSASMASATVDDHGLDEVVPRRDQQVAASYGNFVDPKNMATEQVAELLALDREVRAANLVMNPNSYGTANKTTLSGTSQWSDYVNSNPIAAITAAMDTMMMRPNQLVLSRAAATALKSHPKVVASIYKNQGTYGIVPLPAIADLLEIDEVLIGQGWLNTARKGQAVNMARIWGKSVALLYKKPVSVTTESMSFGITAQWGDRISGTYFDEKKGLRGSDVVRVGESVKEVILANDLGYLFQNAVA